VLLKPRAEQVETAPVAPDRSSLATARPDDTGLGVRRSFERHFEPGEIVFEVDEPASFLYVIQSGSIDLTRPGPADPRIVARLGPGDIFGEMSLLLRAVRTVRAVAVTEARVLELDGATFERMCLERPEIALRIIQRLSGRVIELEQRLAELGVNDLLRPVVRRLVRLADRNDVGARVRTTLRELASETGLTMLDAHRALQNLFERKLVRLVEDALIVPDLEALTASLDGLD
jgi:CRP/FNR family transcriptional regulator